MIARWLVRLTGLALAAYGLSAGAAAEAAATDLYIQALHARPDTPPNGTPGLYGVPVMTPEERAAWEPALGLREAANRRRLAGHLWRAAGFAGLALVLAVELYRITEGTGRPAPGDRPASDGAVRRSGA